MPYITVRYTPIDATNEHNWFEKKCTYIDCTYVNRFGSFTQLEGAIVSSLGASTDLKRDVPGSGTCTFSTVKSPHEVLDVLDGFGYRVVAAVTINQRTLVWTLHKQR